VLESVSWSLAGTRYSSFSHLPRSICRQRSEQKGAVPWISFLQTGHRRTRTSLSERRPRLG